MLSYYLKTELERKRDKNLEAIKQASENIEYHKKQIDLQRHQIEISARQAHELDGLLGSLKFDPDPNAAQDPSSPAVQHHPI